MRTLGAKTRFWKDISSVFGGLWLEMLNPAGSAWILLDLREGWGGSGNSAGASKSELKRETVTKHEAVPVATAPRHFIYVW